MTWTQSKEYLSSITAIFVISTLGFLAISQNFGNVALLGYVCLIFGLDIWVWSRYFIKKSFIAIDKSQKPDIWKKKLGLVKPKFGLRILSFDKNLIFKLNSKLGQKGFTAFMLATVVLVSVNLYFFKPIAALAVASPNLNLNVPAEVMIGEDFNFTATFSNAGTTTGFGPYLDLVFPVTGSDGAGAGVDDGVDFSSASYLGAAVVATQLTFPVSGTGCGAGLTPVTHPYNVNISGQKQIVCGTPGDKLVVLQLPFGSFVSSQPNVDITVNAKLSNLADAGTALNIQGRAGFRYGNDSLYNPGTDPSLVGSFSSKNLKPTILKLSKTYLGPENETATGPNFLKQYRVSVDVASGQKVTNLDLQDFLPNNLAFKSIVSKTPASGLATSTPAADLPQNSPSNLINLRFPSVVGTTGTSDASFVFDFFIPDKDANGSDIISSSSGDDAISIDDAKTAANWTPMDGRDAATTVSSDITSNDHTLYDKSIAIQKSFINTTSALNKPGDILEYSLNAQISDYFAFENVVVTDVFSDGQLIDKSFTPSLNWTVQGLNSSLDFSPSNYTVTRNSPGTGSTVVSFRVSDQLQSMGQNSKILGGCVPVLGGNPDCNSFNSGATAGIIKFRTVVQQIFTDTFPSGEPNVDMGDILTNKVTIAGDVLRVSDLKPTGQSEADTSGVSLTVGSATLSKTVYAVNGSTAFQTPVKLAPGDTVTYRLVYDIGLSDVENLYLIDYLPLPAFKASSVANNFNTTVSGTIPAAGLAKFGPSDTFYGISNITPNVIIDNSSNSLKFDFGDHADPLDRSGKIDILFTVAMQDAPFANGMFLTNQARSHYGTTNNVDQTADSIVQVEINLPNLAITKGVAATDNPAGILNPVSSSPVAFSAPGGSCSRFGGTINSANLSSSAIASSITGIDAGDAVSFAVVLQNTGQNSGGAFDVALKDDLPAGFVLPASGANLCVTNGAGVTVPYTAVNSGDASPFFGSGIKLSNPSASQGAIGTYDLNSGNNIVIVSYDLVVDVSVMPDQIITNTATLTNYSGLAGGVNYASTADFATQTAQIGLPSTAKSVIATNQNFTTGSSVAVGEQIQYDLQINVREGTSNLAKIVDTLDPGLAFVSIDSVTPSSADLATSVAGGFDGVKNLALITNLAPLPNQAGRVLSLDFGTLTNLNTNNLVPESIAVKYTVVVLNTADIARGNNKKNSAIFSWNNGAAQSLPASTASVTVQEPSIKLVKTASPTTGDAADIITFSMILSQNAVANTTDAYDLVLSDPLPAKLTYIPGSLTNTAGLAPDSFNFSGGNIVADFARFKPADTSTFTFKATINNTVSPKEVLTNVATVKYTSLPESVVTSQSTFNILSTERTGNTTDPGGPSNNYTTTGSGSVTISGTAPVKSVVSTSESSTVAVSGTERVAVGEIVRYRLVTLIPEGSLGPLTNLRDQMPNGLRFLNDGTAKIGFVSNGGAVTSSTINSGQTGCGSLNISGNSGNFSPTCPIQPSLISPLSFSSGTDPNFALGTITNTDNDADSEYMVIELNALVDNLTTNQANTALANNFQIFINGSGTALDISNNQNVIIAEPAMTVSKTATQTPVDAGDTIKYNLVFRNSSSGANAMPAFEIVAADILNPNLTLVSALVSAKPSYATVVDTTPGNSIGYTIDRLNPSDTVTVVVTATLNTATPIGFTIPNTATASFTSLPGNGTISNATGSIVPGVSGSANGKRSGSGGALNDYSATSSINVILSAAPVIDKLVPNPSIYTIGESQTYDIKVTLPEGVTQSMQILDTLPAGLSYSSYEILTLAAASNGAMTRDFAGTISGTPTLSNVGNIYTFNFGDTTTAGDNDAANNTFILRISTKIGNIATNIKDVSLLNNSSIGYTNPTTGVQTVSDPTPPAISIKEASLTLGKTVSPASAAPGDVVTYTLTLNNTGNSTAYEVGLSDAIDSAKFSDITELVTPSDFVYNYSSNTIGYSAASLAAGQTRVFTFTAKVVGGQALGTTLNNTANITEYSSMSGTVIGERLYPLVSASASLTVATPDLQISKTDGLSAAIPGQTLVYNLQIANNGTYRADNLVVTETIPAYSRFKAASSSAGWVCVADICTLNLATMAAGATETVQFALTLDSTIPAGVNNFTNTANVADDGTHGPDPTPLNNQASDTDILNFDPDLTLIKTDNDFIATAGDVIPYLLSFANVGSQNATNVIITEQIPQNTTFNSAGSDTGWICGVLSCTISVGDLDVNQAGTVKFAVKVNPTLAAGVNSTINSAAISDDGGNGSDINPTDNSASETTPLEAWPDLKITKTDGLTSVNTNQEVSYTITIENVGTQGATGVAVTDSLPPHSSFVSANKGGVFSSNQIKWSDISLEAGQSLVLSLVLGTATNIPAGVNQLTNQVSVIDDGTNGADPNQANNQASDTDTFKAEPELQVNITDGGVAAIPSQPLSYTIDFKNSGDQAASGVVLTAQIPLYTKYKASLNTIAWICPDNNPSTICSYTLPASLASSSVGQISFVVEVNPTIPVSVTQTESSATITDDGANGPDPNQANNQASEITPIIALPDLTLLKEAGGAAAIPGQVLIYTLNFANIGNRDTSGVVLYETIPNHSTFEPGGSDPGWNCATGGVAGSLCSFEIGDLKAGDLGSTALAIKPNIPWPIGVANISNTAYIDDDNLNGNDPNPQAGHDAQSSISTPVSATPKILATKKATLGLDLNSNNIFDPGDTIKYAVVLKNTGTQVATLPIFTDTLDSLTLLVAGTVTTTQGTVTLGNLAGDTRVSIDLGPELATGETVTITFEGQIPSKLLGNQSIENQALIKFSNLGDILTDDPDTPILNDSTKTFIAGIHDLAVTKTDLVTTVEPGDTLNYTLKVTNNGNITANNITLEDSLPPQTNMNYVSSSNSGVYDTATNKITWPSFSLVAGASLTQTVEISIKTPLAAGVTSINNTATVSDDGTLGLDSNLSNNSATDSNLVAGALAGTDLQITKTDGLTKASLGDNINYAITIKNVGNRGATGIVVTDLLPTQLSFVSASNGGTISSNNLIWNIPDLAAGQSITLNLIAQVKGVGSIKNSVSVVDDGANGLDLDPQTNQASDLTLVNDQSTVIVLTPKNPVPDLKNDPTKNPTNDPTLQPKPETISKNLNTPESGPEKVALTSNAIPAALPDFIYTSQNQYDSLDLWTICNLDPKTKPKNLPQDQQFTPIEAKITFKSKQKWADGELKITPLSTAEQDSPANLKASDAIFGFETIGSDLNNLDLKADLEFYLKPKVANLYSEFKLYGYKDSLWTEIKLDKYAPTSAEKLGFGAKDTSFYSKIVLFGQNSKPQKASFCITNFDLTAGARLIRTGSSSEINQGYLIITMLGIVAMAIFESCRRKETSAYFD